MAQTSLPAGIFSAQWIPTDLSGRLDRRALAGHIEFERRHGISGLLALGSTGEFPQFDLAEKRQILEFIVECSGGLTVYANVTDIRPKVAVELGRLAHALGIAAIALMPPMFYPLTQADLLEYFLHVSERANLPVMLYNFPELAGKRIELETIAAFADRAPLVAVKQSGGQFEYHAELIALGRQKGFAVMSGSDTRLPEVFRMGAAGCIGGLVNLMPDLMVSIDRICRLGAVGDSGEPARRLVEAGRILNQLTFPLNVAAGLQARGFSPGEPKAIVSGESRMIYAKIVSELSAAFGAWSLAGVGRD